MTYLQCIPWKTPKYTSMFLGFLRCPQT
jgi:hypothetical protein